MVRHVNFRCASFFLIAAFAAESHGQLLYWTDFGHPESGGQRIRRARPDGAEVAELLGGLDRPFALAVDEPRGKLYWTSDLQESIKILRANLDGTEVETVIAFDSSALRLHNIAVDPMREKLYWRLLRSGSPVNVIQRANLDASEVENLITTSGRAGSGLVLDIGRGKLYWDDFGRIRRANLNGSQIEELVRTDLRIGIDLAVDAVRGKLYWPRYDEIYRANLDGTDAEPIIDVSDSGTECNSHARGLAVEPRTGRLLWICSDDSYDNVGRIRVTSMNDKTTTDILVESLQYRNSEIQLDDLVIDSLRGAVYWTQTPLLEPEQGRIRQMVLDAGGAKTLIDGGEGPRMIALDVFGGKMYWTDRSSIGLAGVGRILRANLDGSDEETVLELPEEAPWGLALDKSFERVYWTDIVGRRIRRAGFDGTGAEDLLTLDDEAVPYGIAIGRSDRKLYWTVSAFTDAEAPARIQRANLDGSEVETLIEATEAELGYLRGITLDPDEGTMYWTSWNDPYARTDGTIRRANLDGSEVELIVRSTEDLSIGSPVGITVDSASGKLYWTELAEFVGGVPRIRGSNLDGTRMETLYTGGLIRPWGIAINSIPHVLSNDPPVCPIDAGQPHAVDDASTAQGSNELDLFFSALPPSLRGHDYVITEHGSDGTAPKVVGVFRDGESNSVRIELDQVIEPRSWICFRHITTGTSACFGALPGDVNQDGYTGVLDLLDMVNAVNGVSDLASQLEQLDVDRSGEFGPSDLLRLVDLLNGAGEFESWNEASLPPCPLQ